MGFDYSILRNVAGRFWRTRVARIKQDATQTQTGTTYSSVSDMVRDTITEDREFRDSVLNTLTTKGSTFDPALQAAFQRFHQAEEHGDTATYGGVTDYDPKELADIDAYTLARAYVRMMDPTPLTQLTDLEWEVLGFTECQLTSLLLRRWDGCNSGISVVVYIEASTGTVTLTTDYDMVEVIITTVGQLRQLMQIITTPTQEATE